MGLERIKEAFRDTHTHTRKNCPYNLQDLHVKPSLQLEGGRTDGVYLQDYSDRRGRYKMLHNKEQRTSKHKVEKVRATSSSPVKMGRCRPLVVGSRNCLVHNRPDDI